MTLYRFFTYGLKQNDLPDSCGPLSASIIPSVIVKRVKARASEEGVQAAVSKYTSLHDDKAAILNFSKQLEVELYVTSFQIWKQSFP